MRKLFFVVITGWMVMGMLKGENPGFEKAVRKAVEQQMDRYPASTLRDLYKNFFQDKFGPGHLIADTAAAGNYLRKELASYTDISGALAEPTGWEGNFYRVNLSVLKENKIPYEVFFDAFVRSVNGITPVPVFEWEKEWKAIEKIIASMHLNLPGYESEKKEIEDRLKQGEYVGHHSERFEAAYTPHYRIISRTIFEEELKPFLQYK